MRNLALCLFLAFKLIGVKSADNPTGPVGPIKIHQLGLCEDGEVPKVLNFEASIKTVDDEECIDASGQLSDDASDNLKVQIIADQFVNNDWKEQAFTFEETLIGFIKKYFPDGWDRIRNEVTPKIETSNLIPKGEYKLECFKASHNDLATPQVAYGKFRAKTVISLDDNPVDCFVTQVEFLRP